MEHFLIVDHQTIPYEIIRSRRSSYGISVAPGGKVTVRIPLRGSERSAVLFAEEKSAWIARNVAKLQNVAPRATASEKSAYQKRLEAPYKKAAADYFPKRAAYYAPLLGVTYSRITIRDQKTRWGSCSSKGTLSFNWRLMLAPPKILDYVVVHELCHLREMNHSPRFWALVASILPDYKESRKWLKENGNSLIIHE